MSNNKQQTAVDFAFETLANQGLLVYKEYTNLVAYQEAKEMEKEQSNAKINIAIKEFETLQSKANSLKDVVYLDGVLAVLDSIKNETYEGGE